MHSQFNSLTYKQIQLYICIRTGRCYTNHGNRGQPECTHPTLERNPEATAIKSYIAELLIDLTSEGAVSALQMMD
jgi:hypothetical protein